MRDIKSDIKYGFIRFIKYDNISYMFLLSLMLSVAYFLKNMFQIKKSLMFDMYVTPMTVTLELVKYIFILFLFLSFEFVYKIRSANLQEVIGTVKKGIVRYERGTLGVLSICALIFWCILTGLNIWGCSYLGLKDMSYFLHIAKVLFVHVFFIMELAICFGWMTAKCCNRIIAYFILIMTVFLSSFYFEEITALLYETGVDIYSFQEIFSILPTGLKFMPNFHYGFFVELYKIALICFWILICFSFASISNYIEKKYSIKLLIYIGLAVICFCVYKMPSSKVLMNENPKGTLMEGQNYYGQKEDVLEKKAEFQVTSYDIDMQVNSQLNNMVNMSVEPNNLAMYCFTLFHGYDIKSVKNQNNECLEYKREEDYIYVYNENNKEINNIIIEYCGSSATYYANAQGVYLPGYFAYYPKPGIEKMYDKDNYSYTTQFLQQSTYFRVKVSGINGLYTNLEQKENGLYEGISTGPIFMSGFLKSYIYEDMEIVYPYLNQQFSEEYLKEWILDIKECSDIDCPDKVFITPNVNQILNLAVGNDYVTSLYLFDAQELEEIMKE